MKDTTFGMLMGFLLAVAVIGIFDITMTNPEPEPTCEVVQTRIFAFQQCLRFQPACNVSGPEAFAEYFKDKKWAVLNCPDNGDGLQSQSMTSE